MMTNYQYGIVQVSTGQIMAVPTEDQGISPFSDINPEDFKRMYRGEFALTRREVGEWEPVE